MVSTTLCAKEGDHHKLDCLTRTCENCGVHKLALSNLEMDTSEVAPLVTWQCYGYVNVGQKEDGSPIRKLTLINKETKPGELFQYLIDLVKEYPYHDFMARWQREQYDILRQSLPFGHVLAVHDYSENYQCAYQNEIQSLYFSKCEASLHVTMLFRHAELEYDGIASTLENPVIIKEHIFCILDDKTQSACLIVKLRNYKVITFFGGKV